MPCWKYGILISLSEAIDKELLYKLYAIHIDLKLRKELFN